jgi:hypothetical protein
MISIMSSGILMPNGNENFLDNANHSVYKISGHLILIYIFCSPIICIRWFWQLIIV